MRISDWSSDVCSSDLDGRAVVATRGDRGLERHLPKQRDAGVGGELLASALAEEAVGLAVLAGEAADRKSVVEGKSVSVRVDLGGRRLIKKKTINTYL